MAEAKYLAGIETGGTKIMCGVGSADGKILEHVRFPTETPTTTIPKILAWFKGVRKKYPFDSLGIASFGPLDLNPDSEHYGRITTAPKIAWQNFGLYEAIKQGLNCRVTIDTDVNGAALGEYYWGHGRGLNNVLYITIGTGIGAGFVHNGKTLHGVTHTEMGHILLPQHPEDNFKGTCPFHSHCAEGMACGGAIKERWGVESALDLSPNHKAWEFEAHYLGHALSNFIYTLSPQKIILGGGVMRQTHLLEMIHKKTIEINNGYFPQPEYTTDIHKTIVTPYLEDPGLHGAIALARG